MIHRLTIKGQVTIPKEIRDFLGLREGASRVEFSIDEDGTVRVVKAADAPRTASVRRPAGRSRKQPSLAERLAAEGLIAVY